MDRRILIGFITNVILTFHIINIFFIACYQPAILLGEYLEICVVLLLKWGRFGVMGGGGLMGSTIGDSIIDAGVLDRGALGGRAGMGRPSPGVGLAGSGGGGNLGSCTVLLLCRGS